jgi:hypothetical protein
MKYKIKGRVKATDRNRSLLLKSRYAYIARHAYLHTYIIHPKTKEYILKYCF